MPSTKTELSFILPVPGKAAHTGGIRRWCRVHVRFLRGDLLIAVAVFAVMVTSLVRWPDKIFVDVAIPTAILLAFVVWRAR